MRGFKISNMDGYKFKILVVCKGIGRAFNKTYLFKKKKNQTQTRGLLRYDLPSFSV